MRERVSFAVGALAMIVGLVVGKPADAQEPYTFVVSALGGIGGTFDDDLDAGFSNTGLQLNLGVVTAPGLLVSLRAGDLDLGDGGDLPGALRNAGLTYLTTGGEYLVTKPYYDSGLFLGVGYYKLEAVRDGAVLDDAAFGFNLGVTGRFRIRRHWGLLGEFGFHWAAFDTTQLFGLGLAGVSYQW